MGFICNNKEENYNIDPNLINDQNFRILNGMSNIFSVPNEFVYCIDTFNSPQYYVNLAGKPITVNCSDEMILNGSFDGSTGWTTEAGMTIQNNYVEFQQVLANKLLINDLVCEIVSGRTYTLNWDVSAIGNGKFGQYILVISGNTYGDTYTADTQSGLITTTFNSPYTTNQIGFKTQSLTTTLKFTDFSLRENSSVTYNISDDSDINFQFIITGDTNFTGYTGEFCYSIFDKKYFYIENNLLTPYKFGALKISDAKVNSCQSFSALTTNVSGQTYFDANLGVSELGLLDNDYMIRTYSKFESVCDTPEERRVRGLITGTGLGNFIDTFQMSQQSPLFDFEQDWHFVTVTNPPTPMFGEINNSTLPVPRLQTERVYPLYDGQTGFTINGTPTNGKLMLFVNGIQLVDNRYTSGTTVGDYMVDSTFNSRDKVFITLLSGQLELIDVVQVAYITLDDVNPIISEAQDSYIMDAFIVTGFTTNYSGSTTGLTSNFINYNTTKGVYELYLKYVPILQSDLVLTINGITLLFDLEYTFSSVVNNKVNFFPNITINPNDIITLFYSKVPNTFDSGNMGQLKDNVVSINWVTPIGFKQPISVEDAYYKIDISSYTATTFSPILYSQTVPYQAGTNGGGIQFTGVTVGNDYIYRVCLYKGYRSVTNELIITHSCSPTGSFGLSNNPAIYSNF